MDIVANLVEYPYPVVGRFEEIFLEVPDEVLITAMREYQKYFAMIRVKALDKLRQEPLSIVFKRVENILKKADNLTGLSVDESLFQGPSETILNDAGNQVKARVKSLTAAGDYGTA